MNSDLSEVTVGDEVLILGFPHSRELQKVTRATKTQLTVANIRFNRNDGSQRGGTRWDRSRIYVPTAEEAESARQEQRKRDLVYAISTACERDKLRAMSLRKLEAVGQLLSELEASDE